MSISPRRVASISIRDENLFLVSIWNWLSRPSFFSRAERAGKKEEMRGCSRFLCLLNKGDISICMFGPVDVRLSTGFFSFPSSFFVSIVRVRFQSSASVCSAPWGSVHSFVISAGVWTFLVHAVSPGMWRGFFLDPLDSGEGRFDPAVISENPHVFGGWVGHYLFL